jgi:hypothetical protein
LGETGITVYIKSSPVDSYLKGEPLKDNHGKPILYPNNEAAVEAAKQYVVENNG